MTAGSLREFHDRLAKAFEWLKAEGIPGVILEEQIDYLLAEIERLRARAYKAKCSAPGSHSSACITWGDDGRGKGQENPNACSCGAWPEWLKARIEAALAEIALQRKHAGIPSSGPTPPGVLAMALRLVEDTLKGEEP